VASPEGEADLREHLFWKTDRARRVEVTSQIIARRGSTVVFCRTKRGADRLARQLSQSGLTVAAIHGDRSQGQREKALAAFSGGRVQALIATDVAARGIHVDDIACVLHFDPPEDEKTYVHRSGRTGRAGAGGTVLSLVCEDNGAAVRDIQRRLGFPTRFSEPNVGSLAAADVPFRPATSRPQPGPASAERARSERPKPERAKADWPVTAGPAAPRRKPDGRPARNGSRRRSGSSRFRQA
jgi:superfamily II DNA/RNA helicase